MVQVTLRVDRTGLLRECRSTGHSQTAPAGADIVCASVSFLLRSAARALEGNRGIAVSGEAPGPGELVFRIDHCSGDCLGWLAGVGDLLMTGLSDLVREYPEAVGLKIEEIR